MIRIYCSYYNVLASLMTDCLLIRIDSDFDELDIPVIAKAMFMTKV